MSFLNRRLSADRHGLSHIADTAIRDPVTIFLTTGRRAVVFEDRKEDGMRVVRRRSLRVSSIDGWAPAGGDDPAAACGCGRYATSPASHDIWLDEGGHRHRLVLDALSTSGLGLGMASAMAYFRADEAEYRIEPRESSVVMVLRHGATSFGFNDVIWAKYGYFLGEEVAIVDPRNRRPPHANLLLAGNHGTGLPNGEVTLGDLARLGARFAVCATAATRLANAITAPTLDDPAPVLDELEANLIPNARMVAAGIAAVHQAQELGYAISFCG